MVTVSDSNEPAAGSQIGTVDMNRSMLARHDRKATLMRSHFEATNTFVINLVSGPGSGKTTLLTEVLAAFPDHGLTAAALVGDCATDNDAKRLAASGAPVRQIVTEGMCHLEVTMIDAHIEGWDLDRTDVLFIENVGNLVCPAAFDLGESIRIVMLSVTEGEDKPLKYPQIFSTADLIVITKLDLAGPCEFDREKAYEAIRNSNPDLPILETSKNDPASVNELIGWIAERRAEHFSA